MGTEVVARAKHIHMSPRKVRRVIEQLRGLDVDEALNVLHFLPHAAARPAYNASPHKPGGFTHAASAPGAPRCSSTSPAAPV